MSQLTLYNASRPVTAPRRPAGIELSIGTASLCRPLPVRNERGEGWGEGKANKNATPLPGPLLLLRRKRGRRARSIPLIQWQCRGARAPPNCDRP